MDGDALVGLAELADVDDAGDPLLGDQVGDQLARGGLERHVAMLAAEHQDRQARALAIAGGAHAPPVALGVDGDPWQLCGEQLLGEHHGGVRLPAPLHG